MASSQGTLLFHFSGHSSQKVNNDDGNDERDDFDGTPCPLVYESNGMILDDEINEILVCPIPHCSKLHAAIDACHGSTVLDLPYLCRINMLHKNLSGDELILNGHEHEPNTAQNGYGNTDTQSILV